MIGDSQVGKTTYMGAMYRKMTRGGPFRISATSETSERVLRRLANQVARGEYPTRTQERAPYEFTLSYHDGEGTPFDVMNFEWVDYRGGDLHEPDAKLSGDLLEMIGESSAFVVFWDATLLDAPGREIERQWRALLRILHRISEAANAANPIALSIIVTKFDLWARDAPDDYTLIDTRYGQKIFEFIRNCKNDYLHGLFGWSAINRKSLGLIRPPFYRSMHFGIVSELKRQLGEYNNRNLVYCILIIKKSKQRRCNYDL